MTPREALDALRGLVEAVEHFLSVPLTQYHLRWRAYSLLGERAANARPALETLAGCVVLSVDDAKHAEGWIHAGHDSECPQCLRLRAAIAEAEEAMR
jgi:hypothetical protein